MKETEQPGVTVSGIARKHGIVTGLLFHWRLEFGVAQKKRAKLASVALADDAAATPFLRPPEGMMAVDRPMAACVRSHWQRSRRCAGAR